MTTGAWIALAAVALALAFGAYRALTDGRFRGTHKVAGAQEPGEHVPVEPGERARSRVEPRPGDAAPTAWEQLALDALPGERATLVQFSSAFCAPCRTTRVVLADVAARTPGVVHIEIDAEHHLDVVRRLGVLRTPTTLVLDARGEEVARASGAPRREQVLAALPAADFD